MRRILSVIGVLLVGGNCHSIHNLVINGSSSPVVTTVDSLHVHASFEAPGAMANAIMYADTNGNGQIDSGEPSIFNYRLIDGDFDDEDETADGEYYSIREPFVGTGKFVFCAEENGISDTVSLTVNPAVSPHCVHGRVTDPPNQANIYVCLVEFIDEATFDMDYSYGTFTDSSGSYSISIPDESADRWWYLMALDVMDLAPGYLSNDFAHDSIFAADSVTKDIAMRAFSDSTAVYGTWKDNLGDPIPWSAPMFGIVNNIGSMLRGIGYARTDTAGAYRIRLAKAAMGTMYMYFASPGFTSQFYPDLMNPPMESSLGFGPSPAEINIEIMSHRTTATISGHVYKDGEAYDRCKLEAEDPADNIGNTYTKTYSDGRYEMWVSEACVNYVLNIASESIPEGCFVTPEDSTAAPGDTGIDFYLTGPGVEERPTAQVAGCKLQVHPNPFIHNAVVEFIVRGSQPEADELLAQEFVDEKSSGLKIYDLGGRLVQKTDGPVIGGTLETGVYFVKVKGHEPVKMVKLR